MENGVKNINGYVVIHYVDGSLMPFDEVYFGLREGELKMHKELIKEKYTRVAWINGKICKPVDKEIFLESGYILTGSCDSEIKFEDYGIWFVIDKIYKYSKFSDKIEVLRKFRFATSVENVKSIVDKIKSTKNKMEDHEAEVYFVVNGQAIRVK